jgi:hypothetical protein
MPYVPQTLFTEMISEQQIALDRNNVSLYTVRNVWPISFQIVMYELIILKLLEVSCFNYQLDAQFFYSVMYVLH